MIRQETAARIWQAYREIEVSNDLLKETAKIRKEDYLDKSAPTIRDAFGQRQHFQLGIPCGQNGHSLREVKPELAESIIRAHIAHKQAELAEANEQARIELDITEQQPVG